MCPSTDKLLPLAGRILDGKFRFVKQLGEGGMGSVWMAENVLVKKHVAIKLMHVQFSRDEGVLARFRNEATAAGRIGSKHICDILDLGKSVLGPYIVMEMLKGSDMSELVQKRGRLAAGTAVMIVRQALVGLRAAHDVGIVHRDLKPENVFLHEPEPGQLMVKLMDFGISKFTEGNEAGKTGVGVLMGTPEYMSPEQTEGAASVDHRTDVWAIGVILYWAIAGRNPFSGPTLAATLMNVTLREAPPLSQLAPEAPPGLIGVIERCLRKDPEERWPSTEALYDALAPYETSAEGDLAQAPASGGGTVLATDPSQPAVDAAAMSGAPLPTANPASATWSSELVGVPAGSAPTMRGGGDWGAHGESFGRPQSNIGGGKGVLVVVGAMAIAIVGAMAWYASNQADATEELAVAQPGETEPEANERDPSDADKPSADTGVVARADTSGAQADTGGAQDDGKAAEGGVKSDDGGTKSDDGGTKSDDGGSKPVTPKPKPKPKPKPDPVPDPGKVRDAGSIWVKRGKRKFDDYAQARSACGSDRTEGLRNWRLPRSSEARSALKGERSGAYWLQGGQYYNAKTRATKSGKVLGGAYAVCVAPKK